MLHLSTPRLSLVQLPRRLPEWHMNDDTFRLAVIFTLGVIAVSIYALAASVIAARFERITYDRRHA